MNLKVAGFGAIAVIAFIASIYWIGKLGPATDPTNAVAGFFLFQSHCTITAAEPASVKPSLQASNKPHTVTVIQSGYNPSPVILQLVLRGPR